MRIGETDSPSVAATITRLAATPIPTTSTTGAATAVAAAAPLTGGLRTTSNAVFITSDDDSETELTVSDFTGMVARKTHAFATTLTEALKDAQIPTDEPIVLHLDSNGAVTVESPYKERIETFFKEHPELRRQLKEIATLNTLVALNEALRRFSAAKDAARNDEEREKAQAAYVDDCLGIQARSGTMVLAEGELTSAAVGFMAGH